MFCTCTKGPYSVSVCLTAIIPIYSSANVTKLVYSEQMSSSSSHEDLAVEMQREMYSLQTSSASQSVQTRKISGLYSSSYSDFYAKPLDQETASRRSFREKKTANIQRQYGHSNFVSRFSTEIDDFKKDIILSSEEVNLINIGQKTLRGMKKASSLLHYDNDDIILIFGGVIDNITSNGTFVYLPNSQRWFHGTAMPEHLSFGAAVLVATTVYVTGGYLSADTDVSETFASAATFSYCLKTNLWNQCANMLEKRACHGMVVFENSLYVFGGQTDDGSILDSVERYDIESGTWERVSIMPQPCMGFCAVKMKDKIWIIGGTCTMEDLAQERICLSSVWSFDPVSTKWTQVPNLPSQRAYCAAVSVGNTVYVLGGAELKPHERTTKLSSISDVHYFDIETHKWVSLTSLFFPLHGLTAVEGGNKIYAIGGLNTVMRTACRTLDVIDLQTGLIAHSTMPLKISGCCAVYIACGAQHTKKESSKLERVSQSTFGKIEVKLNKEQTLYHRSSRSMNYLDDQLNRENSETDLNIVSEKKPSYITQKIHFMERSSFTPKEREKFSSHSNLDLTVQSEAFYNAKPAIPLIRKTSYTDILETRGPVTQSTDDVSKARVPLSKKLSPAYLSMSYDTSLRERKSDVEKVQLHPTSLKSKFERQPVLVPSIVVTQPEIIESQKLDTKQQEAILQNVSEEPIISDSPGKRLTSEKVLKVSKKKSKSIIPRPAMSRERKLLTQETGIEAGPSTEEQQSGLQTFGTLKRKSSKDGVQVKISHKDEIPRKKSQTERNPLCIEPSFKHYRTSLVMDLNSGFVHKILEEYTMTGSGARNRYFSNRLLKDNMKVIEPSNDIKKESTGSEIQRIDLQIGRPSQESIKMKRQDVQVPTTSFRERETEIKRTDLEKNKETDHVNKNQKSYTQAKQLSMEKVPTMSVREREAEIARTDLEETVDNFQRTNVKKNLESYTESKKLTTEKVPTVSLRERKTKIVRTDLEDTVKNFQQTNVEKYLESYTESKKLTTEKVPTVSLHERETEIARTDLEETIANFQQTNVKKKIELYTEPKTLTTEKTKQYTPVMDTKRADFSFEPDFGMLLKIVKQFENIKVEKNLCNVLTDLKSSCCTQEIAVPVILSIGGLAPSGNGSSILLYKHMSDEWLFAGNMPESRAYHCTVLLGVTIYVTGGFNVGIPCGDKLAAIDSVIAYDIRERRWRKRTPMLQSRAYHSSVIVNGEMFVFGGSDKYGDILPFVEIYDEVNNVWRSRSQLPYPVMGAAVCVAESCIYVIGGVTVTDGIRRLTSNVSIYNPILDRWSYGPSLPYPIAYASATSNFNCPWLYGGLTASGDFVESFSAIFALDTVKETWNIVGQLTLPRHSVNTAAVETCKYVHGGVNSSRQSAVVDNDLFLSVEHSTVPLMPMPVPLIGASTLVLPSIASHVYLKQEIDRMARTSQ